MKKTTNTTKTSTTTTTTTKPTVISRTKAVGLINTSKGRFMTVTFTKEDGTSRTINGIRKNQTPLGDITIYSMQDKGYRSFKPSNITALKLNSQQYKIRK